MKKLLLGVLALSTTIALTGCKNKKSSKGNGLHFEEWIDCYKVYHLDGDISGDIVIPKTYNDKPVTIIPRYGFMDCTDITSITLTENILTISTAAFSNCTKLKFNEYENGYYLGTATNPYYAFVKPIRADVVTVKINDKCEMICGDAFYYNDSITYIELPESIKSINACSFSNCKNLESIKMPKQMVEINVDSISRCKSLKGIIIPKGITTVTGAISYCENMEYVVLPNTIETVYFMYTISNDLKIYYDGKASDLLAIEGKDSWITSENVYSYSETTPTETGLFWHYDSNNNPVVWEGFFKRID